jgi:hypothetical protein
VRPERVATCKGAWRVSSGDRLTACWSFGRTASVATAICRRRASWRGSAPTSAPSAPTASTTGSAGAVRTAVATLPPARSGHPRSLRGIRLRPCESWVRTHPAHRRDRSANQFPGHPHREVRGEREALSRRSRASEHAHGARLVGVPATASGRTDLLEVFGPEHDNASVSRRR